MDDKKLSLVGGLRNLATTLTERAGLASLAGITFGAKRNLFEALGYKRELKSEDYRDRFKRNGVAARIVEALPNATWAGEAILIEDEDPNVSTKFETAWTELETRLHIWDKFRRVDILAGLGRYGIVLLGSPGDLATPLPKIRDKDLVSLSIFAEDDADVDTLVNDGADSRFGLPDIYSLGRLTEVTSSNRRARSDIKKKVHWSRVIHVADGILDDEVYGRPRMERVWNLLDDLEKVTGGGAEAFWLRAHQGIQWDLDKESELGPEELKAFKEQIDEYSHGLRRMVRTRGVQMSSLGSDVADFRGPADGVLNQISSASGIPKRILLGSERGELSSTQDRKNWNDRVAERRSEYAEVRIIRPFVDRMIERGALPKPKQYSVKWPTIQTLTISEKAEVASKWAGLNTAMGETVVTGAEIRSEILELEPLGEDDLDSGLE